MKNLLKEFRLFMRDKWFTFSMISIVVIMFASIILVVTHNESKRIAAKDTCHPYSVLTGYTLDDIRYVVCGNKEHKQVKVEE